MSSETVREHLDGKQAVRPWMLLWGAANSGLLVAVALVWPALHAQQGQVARAEQQLTGAQEQMAQVEREAQMLKRRDLHVDELMASTAPDPALAERADLDRILLAQAKQKLKAIEDSPWRETGESLKSSATLMHGIASEKHKETSAKTRERSRQMKQARRRRDKLRGVVRFAVLQRRALRSFQVRGQYLDQKITAAKKRGVPVARYGATLLAVHKADAPAGGVIRPLETQLSADFAEIVPTKGARHLVWRGGRIVCQIEIGDHVRAKHYAFTVVRGVPPRGGDRFQRMAFDTREPRE